MTPAVDSWLNALVAGGLESGEARAFLETMPTPEQLMPPITQDDDEEEEDEVVSRARTHAPETDDRHAATTVSAGAQGTSRAAENESLIACGKRLDGRVDPCDEVTARAEVTVERRRLGHHAAADQTAAETRRFLAEHVATLDNREWP